MRSRLYKQLCWDTSCVFLLVSLLPMIRHHYGNQEQSPKFPCVHSFWQGSKALLGNHREKSRLLWSKLNCPAGLRVCDVAYLYIKYLFINKYNPQGWFDTICLCSSIHFCDSSCCINHRATEVIPDIQMWSKQPTIKLTLPEVLFLKKCSLVSNS